MRATGSAIEYAMYPPPTGRHLSEEQAPELDDTFLASDPFSYFQSRIASLMSWDESAPDENQPLPDPEPGSIRARFNAYLQRAAAAGPFDKLDVHAQVAADALSVRHHAAEAVVRLACARLAPQPLGGARCLWAEMAASPRQLPDVVDRLNKSGEDAEAPEKMFRAVVPPDERATRRSHEGTVDAVNTYVDWLWYASTILEPGEINLHAAHNKVKHGLAVRTRSDLRMTFTTTRPNADGSMSANMLNDGVDLYHHPGLVRVELRNLLIQSNDLILHFRTAQLGGIHSAHQSVAPCFGHEQFASHGILGVCILVVARETSLQQVLLLPRLHTSVA
jgi:hypothetical protein